MPRRRKPSSSAFEFTGEEAVAAERAFKRRSARRSRRPKISVTSISPLSTINKVLHRQPATPPKTRNDSNPPKRARYERPAAPRSPPSRKRATPPPPHPSSATTPSRRSLRRRLPSFKLRSPPPHPALSSPVPVRVRIRTPAKPQTPPSQRPHTPEDDLSRDLALGREHERKRPRDGDDAGMTVVPSVKKPKSAGGAREAPEDDADDMRGTPPTDSVAGGAQHPAGRQRDIEKQRVESGAPVKPGHELNNASTDDGIKLGTVKEGQSEHAMDGDQNRKGIDDTQGDVPSTDPMIEKKSSAEVTDPAPRAEDKASAEGSTEADAVPSTEVKRSEAKPSDDPLPSCEQPSSANSASAEAGQAPECATPDEKKPFESPVTPLRPGDDAHMPDNRSEASPTNQRPRDAGHDDFCASQLGSKEVAPSLLPAGAGAETTPEKPGTSTDGNPGTAEEELRKDQEVITEGSPSNADEKCSDDAIVKEHTFARVSPLSNGNSKPESDQAVLGPVRDDEIKEETAFRKDEVEVVNPETPKSPRLPAKVERCTPAKASSGVMKRVRFTEPPPTYRSSERKLGFSGIMKMRRRKVRKHRALDADFGDVSVAAAGANGPDEKGRHLLLDELQYLLDGIFKTSTNGSKKGQTADNQVVSSSLQALIKLLLRKSKTADRRNEEGYEDDSGLLVQILVEQPDLLKTIVKRLCTVLGKSRASDALLALVFVIILRATPKMLLLTEHELDLLLNAFFRNSAASLKECEPSVQKPEDVKDTTDKEPQARRRGKLGRMFDQEKPKGEILTPLLKLMAEAEVVEDDCSAFKRETDAASHLMGIAISLILRNEFETRAWMRDNRRLDKVVAVLYSWEKMMLTQHGKEKDQNQQPVTNIEQGASWIVMEASMRVLEFAVLDQVCQQRLARESRVSAILLDLLKTIKSIKTGPLESEWMICAALRLCINLCHGCEISSKQLVDGNGQKVVLNCLVKECLVAGLIHDDMTQADCDDVEESFDVRVLCLAVLASTVNQEVIICDSFRDMQADGVEKRECGAISLILEILRTAELEAKKEEITEGNDENEEGIRRRKKTAREEDASRERRAQFVMERKITIGYVCLLVGALACDNQSNRELIQDLLPGKSFIGVAAVLAEFLEFHHEVGVISGSMNRMYADIIKKIVEPEAAKEAIVIETEPDDTGEDLKVDTEGQGDELDFLLEAPSDRGAEEGADVRTESAEELETERDKTTLGPPIDGAV